MIAKIRNDFNGRQPAAITRLHQNVDAAALQASYFLSAMAVSFRVGDGFRGTDIEEEEGVMSSKKRKFSRVRRRGGALQSRERARKSSGGCGGGAERSTEHARQFRGRRDAEKCIV